MKNAKPATFQINWGQVITSLIIGAVLGAVTLVRISDTNTIIIAGHTKAIESLERNTVSIDLFNQYVASNQREFDAIAKSIETLNSKVDRLLLK